MYKQCLKLNTTPIGIHFLRDFVVAFSRETNFVDYKHVIKAKYARIMHGNFASRKRAVCSILGQSDRQ